MRNLGGSRGQTVDVHAFAKRALAPAVAFLGASVLATPVLAQAVDMDAVAEDPITVTGRRSPYRDNVVSGSKFTEPLLDTPQTITIVPEQVIEDQASTTLRDVLRNVPGVTAVAGEGGGPQGDNLRIRGFAANTDLFIDGVRDTAQYVRDPFNLDSVEVFKGPASTFSGRGSTGGSVNLVTKAPRDRQFTDVAVTGGTDEYGRGVIDWNQPLSALGLDGAALRLNLMAHHNAQAGRNVITADRWGAAPSLAFGLGGDTQFTLYYAHYVQEAVPDYGFPANADAGRPYDAPRSQFYGFLNVAHEEVVADAATARFDHRFNEALSFRAIARYSQNDRDATVSRPSAPSITPGTLEGTFSVTTQGRETQETLWSGVADVTARFVVGGSKHALVAGIQADREDRENLALGSTAITGQSLTNFDPGTPFPGVLTPGNVTTTDAETLSLYLIDTVDLSEQWQISGAARWDRFEAQVRNSIPQAPSSTSLGTPAFAEQAVEQPSWRLALTFKPQDNASFYIAYGTSFNPSAEAFALSASSAEADPEENESWEIGTKWELFSGRLLATGAIFHTVKTNARQTLQGANPGDLASVVLIGEQELIGLEVGLAGEVTERWSVFAGYTLVDSEIIESLAPTEIGADFAATPPQTFNLWTTYRLTDQFEIGGGANFVDERFGNNANTIKMESYWLFDAMARYGITRNVDLQLNVTNIADEEYIAAAHAGGGHYVPGAGRAALLTLGLRF